MELPQGRNGHNKNKSVGGHVEERVRQQETRVIDARSGYCLIPAPFDWRTHEHGEDGEGDSHGDNKSHSGVEKKAFSTVGHQTEVEGKVGKLDDQMREVERDLFTTVQPFPFGQNGERKWLVCRGRTYSGPP